MEQIRMKAVVYNRTLFETIEDFTLIAKTNFLNSVQIKFKTEALKHEKMWKKNPVVLKKRVQYTQFYHYIDRHYINATMYSNKKLKKTHPNTAGKNPLQTNSY